MQLERYARKEQFEPTPQTQSQPQGKSAPAPYQQSGMWDVIPGMVKGLGDTAVRLKKAFDNINKEKKDVAAIRKQNDTIIEFDREFTEASRMYEGEDFEDIATKLAERYEAKLVDGMDYAQQKVVLPLFNSHVRTQLKYTYQSVSKQIYKEKQALLQKGIDNAVESGDIESAYQVVIRGLADGMFDYDALGLPPDKQRELRARVELAAHEDSDFDFASAVFRLHSMKEEEGYNPAESILEVIDQQVALEKSKQTIISQDSLHTALERLNKDDDFLPEMQGEEREQLVAYTREKIKDQNSIETAEWRKNNERVTASLDQIIVDPDTRLTRTVLNERSEWLSHNERMGYLRYIESQEKLDAAETEDDQHNALMIDSLTEREEILKMIHGGSPMNQIYSRIDRYNQYLRNHGDLQAIEKFNADALLGELHNKTDKRMTEQNRLLNSLEKNKDITPAMTERIRQQWAVRTRNMFFDEDGNRKENPPTTTELNQAFMNLLHENLQDKIGWNVFNRETLFSRELGGYSVEENINEFEKGVFNDNPGTEGGTGRGEGFLWMGATNYFERALRFLNSGGLLGRDDQHQEAVDQYKYKTLGYAEEKFGINYRTPGVRMDEIGGGVVSITMPAFGDNPERIAEVTSSLYPHREPTDEEIRNLKNGGKWVLDNEGDGKDTFITLDEFSDRYLPFSLENQKEITGKGLVYEYDDTGRIKDGDVILGGQWYKWDQLEKDNRAFYINEKNANNISDLYMDGRKVSPEDHIYAPIVYHNGAYHILTELRTMRQSAGAGDYR